MAASTPFGTRSTWRPALYDVIPKPRRIDDDPVGVPIEEALQPLRHPDQCRVAQDAHGDGKSRPQVANLEDEGRSLQPGQQPGGETLKQGRRGAPDQVDPADPQAGEEGRGHEAGEAQHPVDKRPMPGTVGPAADDTHAGIISEICRSGARFASGHVAHPTGQHGHVVSLGGQPSRQLMVSRATRLTQRGKRLVDQEDIHVTMSAGRPRPRPIPAQPPRPARPARSSPPNRLRRRRSR